MIKFAISQVAVIPFTIVLLAFGSGVRGDDRELPELNVKVLKFAEEQKGKKVGDGECWTLAADALTKAGAQRPGIDDVPVYEFGDKLNDDAPVFPGDVVQFEKVKLARKTKNEFYELTMPRHTAIVVKVKGKKMTLLHQNFGGKQTVETGSIDLADHQEGTIEFFRPRRKK